MEYELANQYAQRIRQGENGLHQELVSMCIPRLLYLRKTWGFFKIPVREVVDELTSDAVADAFIDQERRELPFSICLNNTFRDRCRAREKIIREQYSKDIMARCDIQVPSFMPGSGTQPKSADVQAQTKEIVKLANDILENHEPFSKQVVMQKTRGSTYPEMAKIFSTTLNECKRVYWHDMNHLREKFNKNEVN